MSRSLAAFKLLACLAALILTVPGAASAQADTPTADADQEEYVEDDYTFDDDEEFEYVDIDSFGIEAEPEADAAASGAATAGAAAAGAPTATVADASMGSRIKDSVVRGTEVGVDALIFRPFGAASTLVGYAFLFSASPFLMFSDDWETARDVFVGERYRYTFDRPIGQF